MLFWGQKLKYYYTDLLSSCSCQDFTTTQCDSSYRFYYSYSQYNFVVIAIVIVTGFFILVTTYSYNKATWNCLQSQQLCILRRVSAWKGFEEMVHSALAIHLTLMLKIHQFWRWRVPISEWSATLSLIIDFTLKN